MVGDVRLRRIYESAVKEDGVRVLVDRVWPRGVRKADAELDHWLRDIAPSRELRQWFAHDPERWQEFRQRYRDELSRHPLLLQQLLDYCRGGTLTLLFSARDTAHNQAVVLREVLQEELVEERSNEPSSPACSAPEGWFGKGTPGPG